MTISERIFINADDFGFNSSINKAIVELFEKRLINSTTLMANMPGFEEAVDLANQYQFANKIGIHLVLTDGTPLSEGIKSINFLFNGIEHYKRYRHFLFFLTKNQKKIIYEGFATQIEKIQSKNISITHIDTHHHVHEMYGIMKIILELQKRYNIPYVRILNNMEKASIWYKRVYRCRLNNILFNKGINYSDLFGNQADFSAKWSENTHFFKNKAIEIMVHPDYNQEGQLVDMAGENQYDFNFIQSLRLNLE
ncbi:MAG: ChbG/HpnK family deacetylase [Bacteroidota bacterium]|nr:ChbG/HpnK family deacetylase [Bacteroidota bacterium]